jgi:hypothetical protein
MSKMKSIHKVFLVIAVLVLAFIAWSLFFNDGGILQTGYNAVGDSVNNTWQTVTGDSAAKLLPSWTDANVDTEGENLGDTNNGF